MTTAISGFVPTVTTTAAPKGFNDLTGQDFLKVMIAQLQQQDPLNPSNSDQLLTQLSQIKSMQSNDQLNTNLSGLSLQNSIGAGSNLMGKMIAGIDGTGAQVQGTVTSVQVQDQKVYLNLNSGVTLPLTSVTAIAPAAAA